MSDHLTPAQLVAWRQRDLSPADLSAADAHLRACESCRTTLRSATSASATMASVKAALQDAAHLQVEELETYLEGDAPAELRSMVEAHVGICERCARELRDLRAFEKMPARAPLEEELVSQQAEGTGLRAGFLRAPVYRWAGAAVMIVVAAILVRYASLNSTQEQPSQSQTAQEAPAPNSSASAEWKDGPRKISISPGGEVRGLEGFPPEYSTRIVNALVAAHFEKSNDVETAWAARELPTAHLRFPDSHLLLGVLECHAGHIPQARTEFLALAQQNPTSPDVQRLLTKLDDLNH